MNTDRSDDRQPPGAAGGPADPDAALADALARSRVLQDAPEPVIQRAIDLFATRARPATAAPAAATPGLLRRLVAVLGFDSQNLAPQAVGLRSAGGGARQLLFSTEGRDIDLRIAPGLLGWQVSGQVLGPDASGRVTLRCGEFEAEQAWNELAEFRFDAVPGGRCQVVLRADDWELALPEFLVPGGHDAG